MSKNVHKNTSESSKVELSVVMPSYNEMKNISRGALDEVYQYLSSSSLEWELILSDDGSTDQTIDALLAFAKNDSRISVLQNHHAGKAPTVKKGMLAASGQWRLFTDFDQSTPLREVERLLNTAQRGYDVVIGSREMVGASRDKEPWYRHLMGRVFNILVQVLVVPGILDTQCGFKLFSAEATEDLFNKLWIFSSDEERKDAYTGAFDVELLFLARKHGFAIREVPVQWKHAETERVSPIKDSLRMFFEILKIRAGYMMGKYAQK